MPPRPALLVVCARNKKRSRTAEFIFKNDPRFHIRSAGLSDKSVRRISENDVLWADLILVMESEHQARIRGQYRHLDLPDLVVLDIPDDFEFMDAELVDLLKARINAAFDQHF